MALFVSVLVRVDVLDAVELRLGSNCILSNILGKPFESRCIMPGGSAKLRDTSKQKSSLLILYYIELIV